MEPSRLDQSDNHESAGGPSRPSQTYQFIDLSTQSSGEQTKNRALVRSHVAKVARRQQNRQTNEQDINTDLVAYFFQNWAPIPARISQEPAMNSTISAIQTYKGTVTPHLYDLFESYASGIWSALYPPQRGEPGIIALEWFDLVRSNPVLFHAGCYVAAAYADLYRSSLFYTVSPEIRRHKIEAIRLINKELKENDKGVSEAVILAILCIMQDPISTIGSQKVIEPPETSPFKQLFFLLQWSINFSGLRLEAIHVNGFKAIIQAKGGFEQLRERIVLLSVSYINLLESSYEIFKPPDGPFYAIPEMMNRVNDPARNIPLHPKKPHRGSGFVNLLPFGLTQEALAVIMEMISFTVLAENYLQGTLKNPDIFAIGAMRDRTHHRLLSLPTGAVLFGPLQASGLYECCRLTTLLFETGVLFPMPRSTGVPPRIIQDIKKCVDQISLVDLFCEAKRPFFIWVLMLTGIATDGLPDRQWVMEMLTNLLALDGVSRWRDIKKIVDSFLWMDFACESGAMELWDDIAASNREGE